MANVDDPGLLTGIVIDLFVGASGQEGGESVHHGQQSLERQAAGHGDHVLLGNPVLNEAFWVLGFKGAQTAIGRQVGIQHNQVLSLRRNVHQSLPEGVGHVFAGDAARALLFRWNLLQRQWRQPKPRQVMIDPLDDLGVTIHERLVIGRAGVPTVEAAAGLEGGRMFHERHTSALDGISDEDLGPVCDRSEPGKDALQWAKIVAVATGHVPPKGTELVFQITQVSDLANRLIGLHLVVVHNHVQVGDTLVHCRLQGFIDLSFLQLTITGHDEDASLMTTQSFSESHPLGLGDAHAQRARIRLYAWRAHVRMTARAAQPPQSEKLVFRQKT